jgi:hypothetical protein
MPRSWQKSDWENNWSNSFKNRPFSTEIEDHLSNTELDNLFRERPNMYGENPAFRTTDPPRDMSANLLFTPPPNPGNTYVGHKYPSTGQVPPDDPPPDDPPPDDPPPVAQTPPPWAWEAYGGSFNRPTPQDLPGIPEYTAPGRPDLPEFSYDKYQPIDPFQAPSLEDARRDPGFEFAFQEGQRALEQSAAAKGMLRSGQTWKDLQKYGRGMADLGYQNVYDRRLGEWDRRAEYNLLDYKQGYDVAKDIYDANRLNVVDAYDWERQAALDEFDPLLQTYPTRYLTAQRQNELAYERARQEYLDDVNEYERNRNRHYNILTGLL